jgi:uncharacterized membrane protein
MIDTSNEILKLYRPAIISQIFPYFWLKSSVPTHYLVATVLDLARRGYIKIERMDQYSKFDSFMRGYPCNFKFSQTDKDTSELSESEKIIVSSPMLFNGNKENDLVGISIAYDSNRNPYFAENFTNWNIKIDDEAISLGIIKPYDNNLVGKMLLIPLLLFILLFVFMWFIFNIGILPIIIDGLLCISSFFFIFRKRRTEKCLAEKAKLRQLRKKLLRVNEINIDSVEALEENLIYATTLGINKKFIALLRKDNSINENWKSILDFYSDFYRSGMTLFRVAPIHSVSPYNLWGK